ncbi:sialate O-acetylesterase [Tichowtungia aerotolerans]|uniref:SUMF1/EgtB/PvdO family nonheme iron enzyme n=1 Tax=Tichowtungia aerotolerans TaxID=2697043 RepID=A0A6P1M268_9BACT|nr:sialate O-acetylesterase [Tichowtungia aerotolerans]QHI68919.1 SUMF1/EgtB/PvdO family nonheme iron enzyme [Tichowtungia aerotolerans]
MFSKQRVGFIVLCSVAAMCQASFGVSLPSVFSDHMIFQRNLPVPVWGSGTPGEKITVEFAGQTKTTVVDSSNHWKIMLDPMPASSKPRKLDVSGSDSDVSFSDVLVGEVWLCSGQSNMEFFLGKSDTAEDVATADYPQIRLYDTPRLPLREPGDDIVGHWEVCSPSSVKTFSGVAYYFGRKIHQDLDVPVGLLLSAYGGSRIEGWIPPCGYAQVPALADLYQTSLKMPVFSGDDKNDRQIPSALYNGMLHAHVSFGIRGALWYQGEANRREGNVYADRLRALIKGWRSLWGYDFPFYMVQIAPFECAGENAHLLPALWDAQQEAVQTVSNTGWVVISDCANLKNIHPRNKKVPGTRLALLAEAKTYGMDVVYSGPVSQTLEKADGELKVQFSFADGLTTRDGKAPDWFEIAGEDRVFRPADAVIRGEWVILSSSKVPEPVAVRFAWHKLAVPNLTNETGIPAAPFRAGEFSKIMPAAENERNEASVPLTFVLITGAGNSPDANGLGSVAYDYEIGVYELTEGQWNEACAATDGVLPGGTENGELFPVALISWTEVAKYCNWLTTGDLNRGVYTISGGTVSGVMDHQEAAEKFGTAYAIPTEDEWYKAAYYSVSEGTYSAYANGSNAQAECTKGIGENYLKKGALWSAGEGLREQNGTYDMGGNLAEFTETLAENGERITRDAYFGWGTEPSSSAASDKAENYVNSAYGFRIVKIVKP